MTAVWSALGLASVAGALAVVPVLAGRGARYSFALPLAMGALGCWISSWPGAAAPVAGAICVGIGLAATPAVASAFARMRSDAATAAVAFTAVTTVFGVGQLLGPLAAGVVADHAGLAAVPLFAAIVFACGTVRRPSTRASLRDRRSSRVAARLRRTADRQRDEAREETVPPAHKPSPQAT